MLSVALRAAPALAATVTVTTPDPIPLDGLTVTQLASLDALQAQEVLLAVSVAVAVIPPTGAANDEGANVKPHDSAAA